MDKLTLAMALVMGLAGSLHCAGMCGPIMLVMPFQRLSGLKKWVGIGLYHAGRVSVYALMGGVLFSFRELFQPQMQQMVSILLGALLLLVGISSLIPTNRLRIRLPWTGFVQQQLGKFMGRPGLASLFLTGSLNGLLPCGLVYMALSAAVNADTTAGAMATMFTFGLGTVPMLISLVLLKGRIGILNDGRLKSLIPVIALFFGAIFILRGLNLGIPYLSPKVTIEQSGIEAACCHKPKP